MTGCISQNPALWLLGCYGAVGVAMTVDFVAGVAKAKALGMARTSRKFRMTACKAGRYLLPMVCLSCVDMMVMTVTHVPALTIAMGAFNVFCEFRSVMENTHTKKQMAQVSTTLEILLRNRDDVMKLIAELIAGDAVSPSSGSSASAGAASAETSAAEAASEPSSESAATTSGSH